MVNIGSYVAAAVGGAMAAIGGIRATAYLPAPLLLSISDTPVALFSALLITFVISFGVAVHRNQKALNALNEISQGELVTETEKF